MQYLMLLANAPDAWEEAEESADDGVYADWLAYTVALHEAGVLVSGAGLHGPDAATSVRLRAGERLLTDGPFADTKEHLVGFYVLEVPDLDAALDWAAKVPNVRTGTVEIRPLMAGSAVEDMLASRSA